MGRAHALGLAARGARVVVNDPKGAGDVAEEIRAAGGESITHAGDVASEFDVTDMVSRTMARWGRIDILVNNAGAAWGMPFEEFSEQGWDKVMDLNLKSPFFLVQALFSWLPQLRHEQARNDLPGSTDPSHFQSAHRVAEAAVRKLSQS